MGLDSRQVHPADRSIGHPVIMAHIGMDHAPGDAPLIIEVYPAAIAAGAGGTTAGTHPDPRGEIFIKGVRQAGADRHLVDADSLDRILAVIELVTAAELLPVPPIQVLRQRQARCAVPAAAFRPPVRQAGIQRQPVARSYPVDILHVAGQIFRLAYRARRGPVQEGKRPIEMGVVVFTFVAHDQGDPIAGLLGIIKPGLGRRAMVIGQGSRQHLVLEHQGRAIAGTLSVRLAGEAAGQGRVLFTGEQLHGVGPIRQHSRLEAITQQEGFVIGLPAEVRLLRRLLPFRLQAEGVGSQGGVIQPACRFKTEQLADGLSMVGLGDIRSGAGLGLRTIKKIDGQLRPVNGVLSAPKFRPDVAAKQQAKRGQASRGPPGQPQGFHRAAFSAGGAAAMAHYHSS